MDEIGKIEKAIRNWGTRGIQMMDVMFLLDTSGTKIAALHPGGGDLSPLSTLLAIKTPIAI